jgi:hypothetical protein
VHRAVGTVRTVVWSGIATVRTVGATHIFDPWTVIALVVPSLRMSPHGRARDGWDGWDGLLRSYADRTRGASIAGWTSIPMARLLADAVRGDAGIYHPRRLTQLGSATA